MDLEIKVPFPPEISQFFSFTLGVGRNIALHASLTARKILLFNPHAK